jgi:hypothetical protein
LSAQVPEALDLQGDAFEEGEGEEQPGLVAGEPAPEAGAFRGLFAGEDEDVGGDVGVLVDVVGVGVVAVVLVVPPGVAHPEQQVAVDESDEAAGRLVAGDLRVAGVVPYEGGAGAEHGEERGQQHGPPGVAGQDDGRDETGECERVDGDGPGVPAVAAVQEPLPPHRAQEGCELASAGRGAGRTA